jgi:hypothetical protein
MLTHPESRKGQQEHYIWSPLKNEKESTAPLNLTLIIKKGKYHPTQGQARAPENNSGFQQLHSTCKK